MTEPWTVVGWMIAGFVGFAVTWMFAHAFVDIFWSDLPRWSKARWLTVVTLLPLLGVLLYVVARPDPELVPRGAGRRTPGRPADAAPLVPADEIGKAARLHEDNRITAREFEILRRQALRY